jgi:hypothetical protein
VPLARDKVHFCGQAREICQKVNRVGFAGRILITPGQNLNALLLRAQLLLNFPIRPRRTGLSSQQQEARTILFLGIACLKHFCEAAHGHENDQAANHLFQHSSSLNHCMWLACCISTNKINGGLSTSYLASMRLSHEHLSGEIPPRLQLFKLRVQQILGRTSCKYDKSQSSDTYIYHRTAQFLNRLLIIWSQPHHLLLSGDRYRLRVPPHLAEMSQ